jgi:integrase/recombinase XerC
MRKKLRLKDALPLYFGEQSLREETIRSYERILTEHIEFLGPNRRVTSVKRRDIIAWQNHLKKTQVLYKNREDKKCKRPSFEGKLSEHTVYKRLKTAQVFWNWLERVGEIKKSPMKGVKIEKPPKPNVTKRKASIEVIRALAEVMWQDPRDWAMFCVLVDTGVRAIGLSNMELSGLEIDRLVAHTIEKGGNPHVAFFEQVTARALARYLKVRPKTRRREVFLNEKGGKMNESSLRGWLYRRCDKAGVERIGPHALRRAVGCHLAMKRVPLSLIQKHMGHSTAEVTARHYMPDGEEELHKMLSQFGLLEDVLGDDFDVDDEDEEDDESEETDEDVTKAK